MLMPTAASAQQSRYTSYSQPVVPWWPASSPLLAVVSIGAQRVTLYDRTGVVATSPISSGVRGHETPNGVYSIIEKKEEHNSNIYDEAEMPFMQRITWSGVALHAGVVPGYPASHGCIRLPYEFAERLFGMTRLNTRVVVVPGDPVPTPISHANLFQPLDSAPQPADTETGSGEARSNTGASADAPMMLGAPVAKPSSSEIGAAVDPAKPALTPAEAARENKAAAARKVAASSKAADEARLAHRAKLIEAGKLQRTLGPALYAERQAQQRVAQAERNLVNARPEYAERAMAAHEKAVQELAAATKAAADTRSLVAARIEEAKVSAKLAETAEQQRLEAVAQAKAADRLAEPVSVFVSRKTSRVYIRQARQPVADFPVTIKDSHLPIGTHVFSALSSSENGRRLNWSVVTVQPPVAPPAPAKGKSKAAPKVVAEPSSVPLATAALDRISFSAEALARIMPFLQTGSSLLISDLGVSIETGPSTDFVVQTKGEEEALAMMTRFSKEKGLPLPRYAY